jgi:hypothetical protein
LDRAVYIFEQYDKHNKDKPEDLRAESQNFSDRWYEKFYEIIGKKPEKSPKKPSRGEN